MTTSRAPGVGIVLDDGESVTTDAYGRYNFPCVRQGMHSLRLDEKTLPEGSAPYADRAIDSERSIRRLVHGIFDDHATCLTGRAAEDTAYRRPLK